jgi:hypothetical protein
MNARKKYSKEFKLDAISLVVDQMHIPVKMNTDSGGNVNT